MTLHETTELMKRAGVGSVIGIIGIILIVVLIRVGIMLKNYYFPPKIDPPTQTFGLLPPIEFPNNAVEANFTYTLQTQTGELPADMPDRLAVFPVIAPVPNFLNLDNIKTKVRSLDFTQPDDTVVEEIQLTDPFYEWDEQKNFNRKIIYNINSYNYKMTSDFLQSLYVIAAQAITTEDAAIGVAQGFMNRATLAPSDLDLEKTTTRNNPLNYVTFPQLFSVQLTPEGNTLVKTTSISKTHVIRVDFYQKDIEYSLITGQAEELKPLIKIKIPVIYPNPPYSTMNFWVTSGVEGTAVGQSFFTHQDINLADASATYKIKSVQAAFDELNKSQGYIASYSGTETNIQVKNIFLAYFLGDTIQNYLMPVYVFEGNNGFFAYVSALTDDQIQK